MTALDMTAGTLAGTGTVTIAGTSTLDGGTVAAAQTVIASGSTIQLYIFSLAGPLTNDGTIVVLQDTTISPSGREAN